MKHRRSAEDVFLSDATSKTLWEVFPTAESDESPERLGRGVVVEEFDVPISEEDVHAADVSAGDPQPYRRVDFPAHGTDIEIPWFHPVDVGLPWFIFRPCRAGPGDGEVVRQPLGFVFIETTTPDANKTIATPNQPNLTMIASEMQSSAIPMAAARSEKRNGDFVSQSDTRSPDRKNRTRRREEAEIHSTTEVQRTRRGKENL